MLEFRINVAMMDFSRSDVVGERARTETGALKAKTLKGRYSIRVFMSACNGRSPVAPQPVAEVTLTDGRKSGGGTLLIGPDVPRHASHANFVRMGATPPGMLRLDLAHDAVLVYRLIRRTRQPLSALSAGEKARGD